MRCRLDSIQKAYSCCLDVSVCSVFGSISKLENCGKLQQNKYKTSIDHKWNRIHLYFIFIYISPKRLSSKFVNSQTVCGRSKIFRLHFSLFSIHTTNTFSVLAHLPLLSCFNISISVRVCVCALCNITSIALHVFDCVLWIIFYCENKRSNERLTLFTTRCVVVILLFCLLIILHILYYQCT